MYGFFYQPSSAARMYPPPLLHPPNVREGSSEREVYEGNVLLLPLLCLLNCRMSQLIETRWS